MPNIPFAIDDQHGHQISGLVYLEEEYLVFEIQTHKKWGIFEQPAEKVKAEFGVVDSMLLKKGLFKDSLYIVPKRIELLKAVPGSHAGEIMLKIEKRYREMAEALIQEFVMKKRQQHG